MEGMEERLQKIMAQAGLGSRRDCEEYIIAGRVRVNGTVAVIGQKADPVKDGITLDGRAIKPAEQKVYIALHKPRYVLSTVDAEQGDSRQTVRDLVPVSERLYPVGRLDFESEGLVLMTNDGELAQKLTHPSHGHSKEYRVLLGRQPDTEQLATWQRGVVLEDGYKTQRAEVRIESLAGKGAWLRIVMREGRKRQIREIGAMLALPVVRIVRVRIGNLLLGELKPGQWRYLTPVEIKALKEDRPGLPAFPDMTRKAAVKPRQKTARRMPGRTAPPGSAEKAPGRTSPPSGTGKSAGRTRPPNEAGKTPSRRTRPTGGGQSSTRPAGETGKSTERRERPTSNRKPTVRKSK
jgi:23S rRNA pseudouridine2605 synthase